MRERNQREPSGPNFLGFGIYLCLAAVVISLVFASCNGGPVYDPKTPEPTATPLILPPPGAQE